ncbi:hypothetical protein FKP32DRAFT_1679521 [Trametes sanguinea]|nr:hypothetical protein FKP32DRAFT_1679521 [Trametes sanguinea]
MSTAIPQPMGGLPAPATISLAPNIGALAIGTFFSLVLYGINAHQFYQYMRQFPKDSLIIKGLAVTVMIFNTLHTIAPMHACYYYLVTNYAQPAALLSGVWSLNLVSTLAALVVFASECFFACRVFLIGFKSMFIAGVALAGTTAVTTKAFQFDTFAEYRERTKVITILSLALTSLGDHLLAGTIIVALHKSRASHASITLGVAAILAIKYPFDLYYAAVGLVSAKLYTVTLFSVLNSRQLFVSRGIRVFNDEPFGRDIISRANRLAVERWNVPQVQDDSIPPVINVKVVAEIEVHGQKDSDSTKDFDSKGLPSSDHSP